MREEMRVKSSGQKLGGGGWEGAEAGKKEVLC